MEKTIKSIILIVLIIFLGVILKFTREILYPTGPSALGFAGGFGYAIAIPFALIFAVPLVGVLIYTITRLFVDIFKR